MSNEYSKKHYKHKRQTKPQPFINAPLPHEPQPPQAPSAEFWATTLLLTVGEGQALDIVERAAILNSGQQSQARWNDYLDRLGFCILHPSALEVVAW